jgi:hypothetical protein
LKAVWLLVRRHNLQVTLGNDYPLQQVNDQYIMEAAKATGISSHDLRFINDCRLNLNVISTAEITEKSGQRIDSRVLPLKDLPNKGFHCGVVTQKRPDRTKWSILFKNIRTLVRPRQTTRRKFLGAWQVTYSDIRRPFGKYRTYYKMYGVTDDTLAEYRLAREPGKNGLVKIMLK